MNLPGKLIAAATLIDRLTEKGVRVGVVTAYNGRDDVDLIVHGDAATMLDVVETLDSASAIDRIGDIKAPCLRILGQYDGLRVSVTSTPQKETA